MAVTYKVETITPTKAKKYLKGNLKNRKPNQCLINRLSRDMQDGKWAENGQTIVISKNDTLIDGQHRLFACISAEVSFRTLVVRGVDEDVIHTIDTGMARTLGNLFELEGMNYSVDRAAVTNNLLAFITHTAHRDYGFNVNVPNTTKFDVYQEFHFKLDDAVKFRCKHQAHILAFRKSDFCLAYFLLERKYGVGKVQEFWDKCINGGDYQFSPTFTLMQFSAMRKAGIETKHRREDLYAILTAFTAWIAGEPLKKLNIKDIVKHAPEWYADFPIKSKVLGKQTINQLIQNDELEAA